MLETADILISVHARFVRAIVARTKRIEIRTRAPRVAPGSRIWLYNKAPVAAVTAVATLAFVEAIRPDKLWQDFQDVLGLDEAEFSAYTEGRESVAALHLGDVQRIEPLSLSSMREIRLRFHPPQFYIRLSEDDPILSELNQRLAGASEKVRKKA